VNFEKSSIVAEEGEIVFTELVKAIEIKKPFIDIVGVYTEEYIQKYKNVS